MKRNSTASSIVQVVFLAMIVILLPVTGKAQETTLTTVIPSSHTLHIEMTGESRVVVDGIAYARSVDVIIPRRSRPEIFLQAAVGYQVKAVLWNGDHITAALQSGKWTAPEITEDVTLAVILERSGDNPQTGDILHLEFWLALLILSLLVLTVCLLRKKKALV